MVECWGSVRLINGVLVSLTHHHLPPPPPFFCVFYSSIPFHLASVVDGCPSRYSLTYIAGTSQHPPLEGIDDLSLISLFFCMIRYL